MGRLVRYQANTEFPPKMTHENSANSTAIDAPDLVQLRLDAQVLGPMISRSQFDRVADHFKEVLDHEDGVPSQDREHFVAALSDDEARRDLAIAINGLLHGKRGMQERFDHCLATLQRFDLATWPLLTVWLAALHPGRYHLIGGDTAVSAGLTLNWSGFCQSQRVASSDR